MAINQRKASFYTKMLAGDVRSGWTLVVGIVLSFFMLVGAFDTARPLLAIATNGSLLAASGTVIIHVPPPGQGAPPPMPTYTEKQFIDIRVPPRPILTYDNAPAGSIIYYKGRYQYKTDRGTWADCPNQNACRYGKSPINQLSDQSGENVVYDIVAANCLTAVCLVTNILSPEPYYYIPYAGAAITPASGGPGSAGGAVTGSSNSQGTPSEDEVADNKSKN